MKKEEPITKTKEPSKNDYKEQLLSYIMELTPDQVDKIISQLPRLSALLEGLSQPCLLE